MGKSYMVVTIPTYTINGRRYVRELGNAGLTTGLPPATSNQALEIDYGRKRMKITLLSFVPFATALLLMPGAAEGHHGWTEFDEKAEVTVEGTVTDFHYVNPHCVVEFEVKDGPCS